MNVLIRSSPPATSALRRPVMSPIAFKRLNSGDREISPPPAKRKVAATTSSNAVANFFKPASQKEPATIAFQVVQDSLLIVRHESALSIPRSKPLKVAAFDLDHTVITTKSGNRFSKGPDDWQWWHATVPAKLKQLDADGYAVVIISNQAAVSLRSGAKGAKGAMLSANNFKNKVKAVLTALELPITVYAATTHDLFRKPRTGIWGQLVKDYSLQDSSDIDHTSSLFVGDAAGRNADTTTGTKKDHSCSDRNFAFNVGIPFHTPEEYFLGESTKPFGQPFDPLPYINAKLAANTDSTPLVFTKKHDLDMVLFCGSPGAGKSTFYWSHLKPLGYERVNQDILKTRDRCVKFAAEYIQEGKPVVVDNTNADVETRAVWIKTAQKLNVPIRLVHFTAPAKLCEHNDTVRALAGEVMNPEKRRMLPKMAFSGFASRYRPPKIDEGFEDITRVDFTFEGTDEQKAIWGRHWIS